MLETCRTVNEALTLLRSVPVASAQTLTLADAGGAIALVECSCRRVEVLRPAPRQPFVCAVNAFHTPAMRAERLEGVDDWAAAPRYRTMLRALGAKAAGMDISGAMALLAGKEGFLCQYDRHSGRGTVWALSLIHISSTRRPPVFSSMNCIMAYPCFGRYSASRIKKVTSVKAPPLALSRILSLPTSSITFTVI